MVTSTIRADNVLDIEQLYLYLTSISISRVGNSIDASASKRLDEATRPSPTAGEQSHGDLESN